MTAALPIALLFVSCQSQAWIAYGFKSGMSRFDVSRYLADRQLPVISEGAQRTIAGSGDRQAKYDLVYCSSPQKLYLMKYRLADTAAVFGATLEKFERRYGEPEGLNHLPDNWQTGAWHDVEISLIWDVSESETILLKHGENGTSTEFQDLSVCG